MTKKKFNYYNYKKICYYWKIKKFFCIKKNKKISFFPDSIVYGLLYDLNEIISLNYEIKIFKDSKDYSIEELTSKTELISGIVISNLPYFYYCIITKKKLKIKNNIKLEEFLDLIDTIYLFDVTVYNSDVIFFPLFYTILSDFDYVTEETIKINYVVLSKKIYKKIFCAINES